MSDDLGNTDVTPRWKPTASVGGIGRPKRKSYHPVDYGDAVRRYQAGETTCAIAAIYGVSATAIQLGLKRRGVRIIPHWERNPYPQTLQQLNAERKAMTHCARGHEFTAENTRHGEHGRNCLACRRAQTNERRASLRAAGVKRLKGWSIEKKGETCCRNCGSHDRVQLHHAIPRGKSLAARADLRNGLPLCHDCHWGWHSHRVTIPRSVFTDVEWDYISSVELTGENVAAWLDSRYPAPELDGVAV